MQCALYPRYDALLAKHTVQATGGARRLPAERSYRERKEREAGLDDGEALDVAGNGDMETCQMKILVMYITCQYLCK